MKTKEPTCVRTETRASAALVPAPPPENLGFFERLGSDSLRESNEVEKPRAATNRLLPF